MSGCQRAGRGTGADLEGLPLPDGVWGSGVRTSRFEIGDEVVSTVDVTAHTMAVTGNGEVLRASMGTPQNPTRGGTHLVIEKYASKVLDSDTVGLPGEYETEVDWAVRLTYSGTFTHAATSCTSSARTCRPSSTTPAPPTGT